MSWLGPESRLSLLRTSLNVIANFILTPMAPQTGAAPLNLQRDRIRNPLRKNPISLAHEHA